MENQPPSNCRKKMEQELIRGRDTANQLLEVIVHKLNILHYHADLKTFAQDLVRKVLRSFTNTLFLLNTNNDFFSEEKVLPIDMKDLSPSNICPKPEDADYKACKSLKTQRGCYKRKSNAVTWEKDSSILIEDGYEWRKYGQKKIMNAKYLRSYYRCSYKSDKECEAIKQVQRIQEDPPLYRTTYYVYHNCKTSSLNSDIVLLDPNNTSSMFISFQRKEEQYSFSSSSLSASTKHEPKEVINPYHHIAQNQLYSCDYELDLRHATTMVSSTQSFDQYYDVFEPCGLDFDSKACFGS